MLTFAVVIYSKELALLELQARSFSRWVDESLVNEILIALNENKESQLKNSVENLIHLYGIHSNKVRILKASQLLYTKNKLGIFDRLKIRFPLLLGRRLKEGFLGHPGWLTQQALKLSFGREATSKYTIILDAKNLWLSAPQLSDFINQDGRVKTVFWNYGGKNQCNWFPPSMAAVGFPKNSSPPLATTHFLTPFPIQTEILRGSLDTVERLSGSLLKLFCLTKSPPTEFFIINSYVLKNYGNLNCIFTSGLSVSVQTSANMNNESISNALNNSENGNYKCLSLHSRAWQKFNKEQNAQLYRILIKSKIVDSMRHFDKLTEINRNNV